MSAIPRSTVDVVHEATMQDRSFLGRVGAPGPPTLRSVAANGGVALAVIVASWIGLAFAVRGGSASPIWPPAGICAAVIYMSGRNVLPGVFAGALVASVASGTQPPGALLAAIAASAEAATAAGMLRRMSFRPQLNRLSDVQALAISSLVPSIVGATIGIGGLALGGRAAVTDLPILWVASAAGDTLSIFVLAAFLLAWFAPPVHELSRTRRLEALGTLAGLSVVAMVLFFDVFDLRAIGESVAFPIIPLVVWVAFRVGPRGNATGALLYSSIAIVATEGGSGPFVGSTHDASLFYVVGFIVITALTGAAVSAVVADHEIRGDALQAATRTASDALARLHALESVGRRLAELGPTEDVLNRVVDVLRADFGYEFPSIYLGDDERVRLGAQSGYPVPVPEFTSRSGVVGRVMRSHMLAFVPDVDRDEDFIAADPTVRSEISAPLLVEGEFLGVLSVESRRRLGAGDVASIRVVADRVATALALARERETLAARAATFQRLVAYSDRISGVLDENEVYEASIDALDAVIKADLVMLTVRDQESGEYIVRGHLGSPGAVGQVIRPGEGPAGAAIRDGVVVHVAKYGRDQFPAALRDLHSADVYAAAVGVPLIREGGVIGSFTVARVDPGTPFTELEREALALLADEIKLAITNALVHGTVTQLAIHDPLTGLHNRRYFDDAFNQMMAGRRRFPPQSRPPLAAIMFDLDHFGEFNKRHGHQVGDAVLRAFGAILRSRMRQSDLVARFGGEEFVVILPESSRDDAVRIANEVRLALSATVVRGVDGTALSATVSAGCSSASAETTESDLIAAADVGLLMAKRTGRNTVVAA